MEIDEFLNKIENGESVELEKPKPIIDQIAEQLNNEDNDKIAISDKVIAELKKYSEKLNEEKLANETIITKIKQQLLNIRNNINSNNLIIAKSSFQEISNLYEMIPEDFSNERLELKKDIASMESILTSKLLEFYTKDFERKKRIILMSIEQARRFAREKNIEGAIREYRRCQEVYHSLSEGFLQRKVDLYEQIVELYKEIIIAAQISNLQNKLVMPKTE